MYKRLIREITSHIGKTSVSVKSKIFNLPNKITDTALKNVSDGEQSLERFGGIFNTVINKMCIHNALVSFVKCGLQSYLVD